MEDGKATKNGSKKIVSRYARLWPEATFITHAPLEPFENPVVSDETYAHKSSLEHIADWAPGQPLWAQQHPDHRVLGQAVYELCNEGLIQHAVFCIEFYHLEQFRKRYPQTLLLCHEATNAEAKKLACAVDAYCTWQPDNNKYALGWHSAKAELIYIKQHPSWYSWEYCAPKHFFTKLHCNTNEETKQTAYAAFDLFNEAFVEPNPNAFQDFSNFTYKHYHNPFKIENNILIDSENLKDAGAMICCVGMPMLMQNGAESKAACLADFAASKDAKPSAALKAIAKIKPNIQAEGCEFSYVDGTDTASAIQMKFGYKPLDGFDVYNIDFQVNSVKHFGSDLLDEIKVLLNKQATGDEYLNLHNFVVNDYQTCPFTETDFETINTCDSDAIRGKRSLTFFKHFVDGLDYRQIAYIVARHKTGEDAGKLAGYMVVELICGTGYKKLQVVDWRICASSKQAVVGALLSHCALNDSSIEWSHINQDRGDTEYIAAFGGNPVIWDNKPLKNKLLVLATSEAAKHASNNMKNWRLTTLDRDYFVNTSPAN